MPLLDLPLVKKHLRVLHDDEDSQIAVYMEAAETIVVAYLDRVVLAAGPLPEPEDEGYDETAIVLNSSITAAILLVTGDLYEVREPDPKFNDGDAVLPKSVRMLLAPWRVWRTYVEDIEDVTLNYP